MVKIVGHRGGRNVWPENGLSGFKKVKALSVDAVEFDIHLTKAGELLCIHDATLERTTESAGLVADLPLDEHKTVKLRGGKGDSIPTFREVLELFVDTDVELHIEIKSDHEHKAYPGIVAAVMSELSRYSFGDRAVLTSFDPVVLREVRAALPSGRRLASVDRNWAERLGGLEKLLKTMEELVDIIAVERTILLDNLALVKSIVPMNRWAVWMANDADILDFWLRQPVYSVTSDRPDLAVAVKEKLHAVA